MFRRFGLRCLRLNTFQLIVINLKSDWSIFVLLWRHWLPSDCFYFRKFDYNFFLLRLFLLRWITESFRFFLNYFLFRCWFDINFRWRGNFFLNFWLWLWYFSLLSFRNYSLFYWLFFLLLLWALLYDSFWPCWCWFLKFYFLLLNHDSWLDFLKFG